MTSITFFTIDHDVQILHQSERRNFASSVSGSVLARGDAGYDSARAVWNGTVDRHPALIVRCLDSADVQAAIRFAGQHRMLTSVRGGGHHIGGYAVAEGGLMIDLSAMRTVHVDASRRIARVGAGALLSDVDAATQAHGLATPLGINSTTGVAGLTLGGGFGWLTRRHGLAVDNLVGAEVVTADGVLRSASAANEPDLFWALRGGGGNFGIVTEFQFALHPVGPQVWAGLVVYPFDDARRIMRAWRDWQAMASDDLTVWAVLRKAPPLPFLPQEQHGREVVVFALLHAGSLEAGERESAAVLGFGKPVGTAMGPTPYAAFQQAFDPLLTPGARNYWKSNNFTGLSDAALDGLIDTASRLPTPESEIFVARLGGAMARVAPAATAFAGRDAQYIVNLHGRGSDASTDGAVRNWARASFEAAAAHATGGGYVNFLTDDEAERVAACYGPNLERLAAVKQRYDPANLLRMNLNVRPARVTKATA